MAKYRGVFKRGEGKKATWWARFTFVDETGKKRDLQRRAESQLHAKEIRQQLENDYQIDGGRSLIASVKTFRELADYYEKNFLKPPIYHKDSLRKIEGLRSWKTPLGQLNRFRGYFNDIKLKSITYSRILAYRNMRLQAVSEVTGKPLSIATVNRELTLLRRMLNIALRENWITRNPFNAGESLVSIAGEIKRDRILTVTEEKRLLDACYGRRDHLRLVIMIALDTGMRRGEILHLSWQDIDFDKKQIIVLAENTKTATQRKVPLTKRVFNELNKLKAFLSGKSDPLSKLPVFYNIRLSPDVHIAYKDIKHSFASARIEAGLENVRFHDLRHTAATRLIRSGLSVQEVGKVLGHTQAQTTYRYINVDDQSLHQAASAMDNYTEFANRNIGD